MTTQNNSAHRSDTRDMDAADDARLSDDPIFHLARQAMAKVVAQSRGVGARQPSSNSSEPPQGSTAHVAELAQALADTDHTKAHAMISDLLTAGVEVRDLYLDHLAPAARELGAWWERDAMQFADVTMAAARIQSILRTIPTRGPHPVRASEHRAVFASVPGETHTLGVIMAADHFRRLGWDVGLLIGMEHAELCRKIADDDRRVIGLSCAGRHAAPALGRLIKEIRYIRPDMGIVMSGSILSDVEAMERLPEVDCIVESLSDAEALLEGVVAGSMPQDVRMSAG